jgi:site-specific recombinase XerD
MLDRYLEFLKTNDRSTVTLKTYKGELQKFGSWANNHGLADLLQVTPIDVQEYRRDLLDMQRKPATINKALVVLKDFYRWCSGENIISANPTERVKLVERQQQAPKWLERSEQLRLKRAVLHEKNEFNRLRDMAAIMLMMSAGLRVEEVVDVTVDDVQIAERKGKVIVREGKRGKYREIPLNTEARKALADYLSVRSSNSYAANKAMFLGQRGPLVTRAVQHMLEKYGQQAQIEYLSAHRLRHTFCHELVAAGERLDVVARLAGHKSINTTALYTTPGEKDLANAVEKISWECGEAIPKVFCILRR